MNFLPIVSRELTVAARKPSTFWIRWGAAVCLAGLFAFLWMTRSRISVPALSHFSFVTLSSLILGCAMIAGVFLTADFLSEEKREGTLGLLFLTPLSGFDVVLGKLFSTSLNAFYGLLAMFPILGIPLVLGGVAGSEFWRVLLVLLITLVFSLAIGMLCSALCRDAKQSMSYTFGVLLIFCGLVPAVRWLQIVTLGHTVFDFLQTASPVNGFQLALAGYYSSPGGAGYFWWSAVILFLLAVIAFGVASRVLPWMWQDKRQRVETRTARGRRRNIELWQAAWRLPVFYQNPFEWLMMRCQGWPFRQFRGAAIILCVVTSIWAIFIVAAIFGSSRKESFIAALFAAYALHVVGKLLMAIESTRQLSEDRQSGALELLLVTPLREKEILSGHARAFSRRTLSCFRLLMVVNVFMMLFVLASPKEVSMSPEDQAIFIELFVGGFVALVFDRIAIRKAGPLFALRSTKHVRATLTLVARLLLPNWIGVLLVIFILRGAAGSYAVPFMTFGAWLLGGFLNAAVLSYDASYALSRGFRRLILNEKRQAPTLALPRSWPRPGNASPQNV